MKHHVVDVAENAYTVSKEGESIMFGSTVNARGVSKTRNENHGDPSRLWSGTVRGAPSQ